MRVILQKVSAKMHTVGIFPRNDLCLLGNIFFRHKNSHRIERYLGDACLFKMKRCLLKCTVNFTFWLLSRKHYFATVLQIAHLPKPKCGKRFNFERKTIYLLGKGGTKKKKNLSVGPFNSGWVNLIKRKHTWICPWLLNEKLKNAAVSVINSSFYI